MIDFSCVRWHTKFTVKCCQVPVSKLSSLTEKAENGDGCNFFSNSNSSCLALSHLQLSGQDDPETQIEVVPPAALHQLEIHEVVWFYLMHQQE